MAESNGKIKWIHWLVGSLFLVVLSIMTCTVNNVIANDKESRIRDEVITEKLRVQRIEIMTKVSGQYSEIVQRLTAIESAVGVRNAKIRD